MGGPLPGLTRDRGPKDPAELKGPRVARGPSCEDGGLDLLELALDGLLVRGCGLAVALAGAPASPVPFDGAVADRPADDAAAW